MTTPVDERDELDYSETSQHLPGYNVHQNQDTQERSSDEEGTVVNETNAYDNARDEGPAPVPLKHRQGSHLTVQTDYEPGDPLRNYNSPSQSREMAHRLDDDLAMLKIERQVSQAAEAKLEREESNMQRSRSRRDDTIDEFDIATNPVHEKTAVYKPPAHPSSNFSKFVKKVHQSSFIVRYVTYITPVVLILLIPLLIGALVSPAKAAAVGGVKLLWFMIWLEIVWLTLWAGRVSSHPPYHIPRTLLTNTASCQMSPMAHWSCFELVHKQQQEMARSWKSP